MGAGDRHRRDREIEVVLEDLSAPSRRWEPHDKYSKSRLRRHAREKGEGVY